MGVHFTICNECGTYVGSDIIHKCTAQRCMHGRMRIDPCIYCDKDLHRLLVVTLENSTHVTFGGFAADIADALKVAGYVKVGTE
jgi:hypothetical protein